MTGYVNITYHKSTHAPLYKRWMGSEEGFVEVGEDGRFGPVDENGAEYRALGGDDHRYNRDYKVGSSYPPNGFITARNQEGDSLTHDELEEFLEEHGLWTSHLKPVVLPKGYEYGEVTWYYGFMYTPVERAPKVERFESQLERIVDDPNFVYTTRSTVEAGVA